MSGSSLYRTNQELWPTAPCSHSVHQADGRRLKIPRDVMPQQIGAVRTRMSREPRARQRDFCQDRTGSLLELLYPMAKKGTCLSFESTYNQILTEVMSQNPI